MLYLLVSKVNKQIICTSEREMRLLASVYLFIESFIYITLDSEVLILYFGL